MKIFLQALYVCSFFGFILILLNLNEQIKNGTFNIMSIETIELFILLIFVISIFIIFRLTFFSNKK